MTSQMVTNDEKGQLRYYDLFLRRRQTLSRIRRTQSEICRVPDCDNDSAGLCYSDVLQPRGFCVYAVRRAERRICANQSSVPTRAFFDLSGNIQQRTFNRWDTVAHGNSTFVGLGRQMIENFASDGTHRDKATDYLYSSTTDDLIQQIDYGEVTGNSDGTFSDTGSDKRTTNYAYAASSSVNMSLPIEKTLFDYTWSTSSDQKALLRFFPIRSSQRWK